MRWESLFADLERDFEDFAPTDGASTPQGASQEASRQSRDRDLIVTFTRIRVTGTPVTVTLADGSVLDLAIRAVGRDWLTGHRVGRGNFTMIIPLSAVVSVDLPEHLHSSPESLPPRVTLAEALRVWSRRTLPVTVITRSGAYSGQILGSGMDYLDLSGSPLRSRGQIRRIRIEAICVIVPGEGE